jgi:G3E family GTPase
LQEFLASEWPGVLRSKGFFWLATRMAEVGEWAQAGAACRTSRAGFWWAAIQESGWPTDEAARAEIRRDWGEPYGDRRQEIVLIGVNMDEASLRAGFERCLLNDIELSRGPKVWKQLPDPFPSWSETPAMNATSASA